MEEIAKQWRDGLITDTEFNMKMLDVFHRNAAKYLELMSGCVSDMMKRDEQKYWYRILNPEDVKTKASPILLTPIEAEQLNRYLKPGYIWHSDVAASVAKGELTTI